MKKFPSGSPGSLYAHSLPGAPLSTKCGQQSIEGYARDGDLSVDGAQDMNRMVTGHKTQDLYRFRPSA
jgi:hypothetical protein